MCNSASTQRYADSVAACVYNTVVAGWLTCGASDRKARRDTDAGTIPRCSQVLSFVLFLFFPPSQFSVQTSLTEFVQPTYPISCFKVCAHVENPKHWDRLQ